MNVNVVYQCLKVILLVPRRGRDAGEACSFSKSMDVHTAEQARRHCFCLYRLQETLSDSGSKEAPTDNPEEFHSRGAYHTMAVTRDEKRASLYGSRERMRMSMCIKKDMLQRPRPRQRSLVTAPCCCCTLKWKKSMKLGGKFCLCLPHPPL